MRLTTRFVLRPGLSTFRLLVLAALVVTWTAAAMAHPPGLRPLATAPSATATASPASPDRDERLDAIAAALRRMSHTVKTPIARTTSAPSPRGRKAPRNATGLRVVSRPDYGAPRQIIVQSPDLGRAAPMPRGGDPINAHAAQATRDKQTAKRFLSTIRSTLRLTDPERELAPVAHFSDPTGRRHVRFRQRHKGLPVWPCELTAHLDAEGNVELVNGAFAPTPRRVGATPTLTSSRAMDIAMNAAPDGHKAYMHPAELIFHAPSGGQVRLAYKVGLDIAADNAWTIIVDAHNGDVLDRISRVAEGGVSGSGVGVHNVTRQLNVWSEQGAYYLLDASKPMYIAGQNIGERGAILVYDMENRDQATNVALASSGSATSGWLADGVSGAFNLSETYDYYYNRHNLNSIDNNGQSLRCFVRYGENYNNAFWNSEQRLLVFGDGQPYVGALDIVAHEVTHGVTTFHSNLIYQNQPGALNEAMSDIFGEAVEAYSQGDNDWGIGTTLGQAMRDLRNPGSIDIPGLGPYPSKMSEYYSLQPDQDHGGVHINCTIVAHAFYLLAEGLDGAIGINDAAAIFFRANTVHLMRNSQFIDCRLACLRSAEELFGAGSNQVSMVAAAFDAVEIYGANEPDDDGGDDGGAPTTPPSQTPVAGDDATLMLFGDGLGGYYPGRRESALGDPDQGAYLSYTPAALHRPSVTGDGSIAAYVTSDNDMCMLNTDGSNQAVLGFPGIIHSVAMSPDGQSYAFVFLGADGNPTNSIYYFNLATSEEKTFELVSPADVDGNSPINMVQYADAMDFTADGQYLIYDALNLISADNTPGGGQLEAWSIYALDLATGSTKSLVAPRVGYNYGYPSLSQTSDGYLVFDAYNVSGAHTKVYAGNLLTGEVVEVGSPTQSYAMPVYNGDDSAIVYSLTDSQVGGGATSTGMSLVRRPLAGDHLTPSGDLVLHLANCAFGVIYRRGDYQTPTPDIALSASQLDYGQVGVGSSQAQTLTITNQGLDDLYISDIGITGTHAAEFGVSGPCVGQTLASGVSCRTRITFAPATLGTKSAAANISCDDPDTPNPSVSLSATAAEGDGAGDKNKRVGWWYDPSRPGSGVSLETLGDGLFMAWFLYDTEGDAEWYSCLATKTSGDAASGDDTYQGSLNRVQGWPLGGAYDPNKTPAQIGAVTLSFSGDDLTVNWSTPLDDAGSIAMSPLLPDQAPGEADSRDIHGWWLDPAYEGMGFFTRAYGGKLFAAWYHYRDDRSPRWWSMYDDFTNGADTFQATMIEQSGGQPLGGAYSAPQPSAVENIFLTFNPDGSATFTRADGTTYALERYDFSQYTRRGP